MVAHFVVFRSLALSLPRPSIPVPGKENVPGLGIEGSDKIPGPALGRKINDDGPASQNDRWQHVRGRFASSASPRDLCEPVIAQRVFFFGEELDGSFPTGMVDGIGKGPDKGFGTGGCGSFGDIAVSG